MKLLLLDTHVFLWAVSDPDRLETQARNTIEDNENPIFVSSVSVAEIEIKRNLGKLKIDAEYDDLLGSLNAQWLDLDARQAASLRLLPNIHKDPFDRLLLAQAITNAMTLVTADRQILKYDVDLLQA